MVHCENMRYGWFCAHKLIPRLMYSDISIINFSGASQAVRLWISEVANKMPTFTLHGFEKTFEIGSLRGIIILL